MFAAAISAVAMMAVSCGSSSTEEKAKPAPVIWNMAGIDAKAQKIQAGETSEFFENMKKEADEILTTPDPTVVEKPHAPVSGDIHDYMSLSRYWWPDPDSPDGLPYIRHDGLSNPELNQYDRHRLGELGSSVQTLALVYYVSGEQKYADKAISRLRTWFVNPETRMNPNLKFAQIRKGQHGDNGYRTGLLDGYSFVNMLDAVALLERKEALPQTLIDSMQMWFGELSEWMLTSQLGIDEGNSDNNHAVAYDAQVIRYAMYGGRDSVARAVINAFPARRLDTQVTEDGRQPVELARTNAFGYTNFNIGHMLDISDMAKAMGIDLYPASNRAIERAIDWMLPFTTNRDAFEYQQIGNWDSARHTFARNCLRASKYGKTEEYKAYYEAQKSNPESATFEFLYVE